MHRTHAFLLRPLLVLAVLTVALPPAHAGDGVPPGGFPPPGGAAPASNLPPPTSQRIRGGAPTGSVALPGRPATPAATGSAPTAAVRREVSGTGIIEVRTSEDLPLTGGGTAVQLVVQFRVLRDEGRHFYVNALFFDRATGQAVAARRTAFADTTTGALYVISQPAVHAGGDREYEVTLQVPHDAFPLPPAGGSASIDARVSLFRRSLSGGMDESMDWTTTGFTVRGPAPAPAPVTTPVAPTATVPATAPAAFPAPSTAPDVGPESRTLAPATPAAQPAGSTRIVSITKHHNQAYPDGRLGLVLDVTYSVSGDQGRSFYLHAVFLDRATGQAVRSVRSGFGDRTTGALYILTQPSPHSGTSNTYRTQLWVPYDAFPRPTVGSSSSIEARISLFRRDQGAGMDASMDVSSVTFNIHGS